MEDFAPSSSKTHEGVSLMTIFTLYLGDLLFDKQVDTLRNTMVQWQRLRKGAAREFSSISTDPCSKGWQVNVTAESKWPRYLVLPFVFNSGHQARNSYTFLGNRHRCTKAQVQTAQLLPNDLHLNNLVNWSLHGLNAQGVGV